MSQSYHYRRLVVPESSLQFYCLACVLGLLLATYCRLRIRVVPVLTLHCVEDNT